MCGVSAFGRPSWPRCTEVHAGAKGGMEYLIRFLIGGAVVSVFAVLGERLPTRSFAGIFGAADNSVGYPGAGVCRRRSENRFHRRPLDGNWRTGFDRLQLPYQLFSAEVQLVWFAIRVAEFGSLVRRVPWSMGIVLLDGSAMRVRLKLVGIRETKWHEYLVRFDVGGLITVTAGLIAEVYGPVIGGLFLAFPSILPASITLVQSHKEQEERGKDYDLRERIARQAAGVTAAGTTLGGVGLLCFAMTIWVFAQRIPPWIVLSLATIGWITVNVLVWRCRAFFCARTLRKKAKA